MTGKKRKFFEDTGIRIKENKRKTDEK